VEGIFMKRITAAVGVALGLIWVAPAMAGITGPVRVETGLLSGTPGADASITAFKGIPYAAPPVGELRWRPPQPAAKWQGVRKAEQFGPICPQPTGHGAPAPAMSEDCLFLNVWTGAKSSRERRPVMVWIHGAGQAQAGSHPLYDGEALAKKGVVVVTVDYRILALGTLVTPELSKESGHNASGNYSLLDDIAALKWVQKNIAAFGGDVRNVTLFGQSHGAASQHFLVMSPLARGLFRRIVLQSHARYPRDPTLFEVATRYDTLSEAEESGTRFVERLGVHSLQELRELPWQRLIATPGGGAGFVVDGYVVPYNYTETYATGTQHNVLVIAGFNKDETGAAPDTAFERISARAGAPRNANNNVPQAIARLADHQLYASERFGSMADEFLKLYPATNDQEAFRAHNDMVRDNGRVSLWMWATSWRQKTTNPIYLYYWTHAPPGRNHDATGAYHGSEIAYAFNHGNVPSEPWTDEDQRIGDVMSSYWVNFAKTGNPNGPGLPQWAAFDGKSEQVMELGDQFMAIPLGEKAKFDFWKRFYQTQPAR
jgi:para-nitrobenzyl esterase